MAGINVKRFVDINIQPGVTTSVISTRDTVVLYTAEGTASTEVTFSSLAEAKAVLNATNFAVTLAYLTVFFNNGGVKCKIIEGVTFNSLTAADILDLPNENIIVCFAYPVASLATGYAATKALATALAANQNVYGVNEKYLLARTSSSDNASVKNLVVKYSTVLGAEMTIAAYLSQINVYTPNSVNDYAFTTESLTAEALTDSAFGDIIDDNMNVDITLANATRNMGGNCKDGADVVNNYVRIILHQTLTDRLLNLLVQKIKNARGISQIYATIAQELEVYKTAGYLTTDKIWTKPTLSISYNNQNYTIIEQGTALISGYAVRILPLSSLTDADKAARKAPPIYVILADQYGIRVITVNGEVI